VWTIDGISLRPFELDDVDTVYEWYHSNSELNIFSSWGNSISKSGFRSRMEQSIKSSPSADSVSFGIVFEGELIGRIVLERIDQGNRIASLGLNIGKKEIRGRGVGRIAARILVDYGFKAKNLEKIYGECYGFNIRAQRCLEAVGFEREGVLRKHELHNGERHDVHFFGLLKSDFYKRYETLFTIANLSSGVDNNNC
jgi:RimJ/RimL family protein N-acetyltransferase